MMSSVINKSTGAWKTVRNLLNKRLIHEGVFLFILETKNKGTEGVTNGQFLFRTIDNNYFKKVYSLLWFL